MSQPSCHKVGITHAAEMNVIARLRAELAIEDKKLSKDKLQGLFEVIDNHALILSLEGKLEDILLFANLNILLLIKYAPEYQERLLPLCHSLRVHLATAPKCSLSLTVRNNLSTALIHFRCWQLAYTQSGTLAEDIETEIKKNFKLKSAIQTLEVKGSLQEPVELDPRENKLIVLLLSAYLNMVLGGRSVNQSDIIHLSSLVQVLQKAHRIAKDLLHSEDFQKKLKHLLKSLMKSETISITESLNSNASKVVESHKNHQTEQDKDKIEIVKMICGESGIKPLKNEISSYSPFKTISRSNSKLHSKWTNLHKITSKPLIKDSSGSGENKVKIKKMKPGNNTPVNRSVANLNVSQKKDNFIVKKSSESKELKPRKSSTMPSKDGDQPHIFTRLTKQFEGIQTATQKISLGSFNLKITKTQTMSPIKSMAETGIKFGTDGHPLSSSIKDDHKQDPSDDQSDLATEEVRKRLMRESNMPQKSIHARRKQSLEISKNALKNLIGAGKKRDIAEKRDIVIDGDNDKRVIQINVRQFSPQDSSSVGVSPNSLNSPEYPVPGLEERRMRRRRGPNITANKSNSDMSATLKKTSSLDQSRNPVRHCDMTDDKSHDQTVKLGYRERMGRKKLTSLKVYRQEITDEEVPPHSQISRSFNSKSNIQAGHQPSRTRRDKDSITEENYDDSPIKTTVLEGRLADTPISNDKSSAVGTSQIGPSQSLPFNLKSPTFKRSVQSIRYRNANTHNPEYPCIETLDHLGNIYGSPGYIKESDNMSHSASRLVATERYRDMNQGELLQEYIDLKEKLRGVTNKEEHVERSSIQSFNEVLGERSFLIKMVEQLLTSNHNLKTQLKLKSGINSGAESFDIKSGVNSFASDNNDQNKKDAIRSIRAPVKLKQDSIADTAIDTRQVKRSYHSLYYIEPLSYTEHHRHQTAIVHTNTRLANVQRSPSFAQASEEVSRKLINSQQPIVHRDRADQDYRGARTATNLPRENSPAYQNAINIREKNKTLIYGSPSTTLEFGNSRPNNYSVHSLRPNWLRYRCNFLCESVRVTRTYLIDGSTDFICSYIKAKMNQASKELEFEFSTYIAAGSEQNLCLSRSGMVSRFKCESFVYTEQELIMQIQQCDPSFIEIYPNAAIVNDYIEYFLRYFMIRYTTVAVDQQNKTARTVITQTPEILETITDIEYMHNRFSVNLIHNWGLSFWLAITSPMLRWPESVRMKIDLTFDRPTFEDVFSITKHLQDSIDENAFRLKVVDYSKITPALKNMVKSF